MIKRMEKKKRKKKKRKKRKTPLTLQTKNPSLSTTTKNRGKKLLFFVLMMQMMLLKNTKQSHNQQNFPISASELNGTWELYFWVTMLMGCCFQVSDQFSLWMEKLKKQMMVCFFIQMWTKLKLCHVWSANITEMTDTMLFWCARKLYYQHQRGKRFWSWRPEQTKDTKFVV